MAEILQTVNITDKLRVAAYVRVSTAMESQQSSFINQTEIYRNRITANPDWVLAGIYADAASSGTTDKRAAFRRLLRDCEQKLIDRILVKSISRFARNTLITVANVRKLNSLGIPIFFEKENIDTSKPYSEMLLTILAAFAQEESRNISQRMKKGLQMRAQNGSVRWIRTYGYRKGKNGQPVIEPTEAKVVQKIFKQYELGRSIEGIAADLNAQHIPSATGKVWTVSVIRDILCNPRYVGDIHTNKYITEDHLTHKVKRNRGEAERIYIKDHHEAIIDRKTFDRVQVIRTLKNREKGNTVQYPFGRRVHCPFCAQPMQQRKSLISHGGSLWECKNGHCQQFCFRSNLLEEAVLKAYEKLNTDIETEEITHTLKQQHPPFKSVEYWWVDDVIKYVTIGKHDTKENATVTVFWKDGTHTTVFSGVKKNKDLPATLLRKEKTCHGRYTDSSPTQSQTKETGCRLLPRLYCK